VCDDKSAILYVKMVEMMRREGRSEEYQHGWVRSVWLAKALLQGVIRERTGRLENCRECVCVSPQWTLWVCESVDAPCDS
jgi:hypothetical protein